ncbi:MAG: glycine betaine ABC transporter substrate-binding protein [Emergencia sp.]
MISLVKYMAEHISQIMTLLFEHIEMTAISVGFAIVIGVPLGILISYVRKLDKPIIGAANVVQAIPSMALLGLAIPLLGIGTLPAIVMVIIYSLLPIIKNTYTGIASIDPEMVEAAKGIGLTKWQVLQKVKLPMALPVIMAGVRISAVTAVGLMTMAAFIGAGGLGYLVFSGIRTVNNLQILAGAIPACILALLVDFLMGLVEKLVTPISLQKNFSKSKQELKRKRRRQKVTLAVAGVLVAILVGNSAIGAIMKEDKTIVVGSKDFTEQLILCNMYADVIENDTDINVVREENLGGSQVCYEAMKKGEVDMYIDYTGTIYVSLLGHTAKPDMEAVYNECKEELAREDNITLLPQASFNNTYTLAVSKETAAKYGLSSMKDFQKCDSQLTLGATLEFLNRPDDGLPGLEKKYNIEFKDAIGLDGSPRFTALETGEVDVVNAFATDGLLKKYDLVTLTDDEGYFPPYYAVPMIRQETLDKYPELEKSINRLGEYLTDEVMQELNYQVDEVGREPAEVAREFLTSNGLI